MTHVRFNPYHRKKSTTTHEKTSGAPKEKNEGKWFFIDQTPQYTKTNSSIPEKNPASHYTLPLTPQSEEAHPYSRKSNEDIKIKKYALNSTLIKETQGNIRSYYTTDDSGKQLIGQKQKGIKEIDGKKKTKKEIGKGCYGTVFTFEVGRNNIDFQVVKKIIAAKHAEKICIDTMKRLYNQAKILRISDIIIFPIPQKKMVSGELVLLMPYIKGRNLEDVISDKKFKTTNIVGSFNTYLITLRICHDNNIFLEDHKPANIIIDDNEVLHRIDTDFESFKTKFLSGSPRYTAPIYTKLYIFLSSVFKKKGKEGITKKTKTLYSLYEALMVATSCILREKKDQKACYFFCKKLDKKYEICKDIGKIIAPKEIIELDKIIELDETQKDVFAYIKETVLTCIKPEHKELIQLLIDLLHEYKEEIKEKNISEIYGKIQKIPHYQLLEYTG
jgi:serine/threonine protein kinase